MTRPKTGFTCSRRSFAPCSERIEISMRQEKRPFNLVQIGGGLMALGVLIFVLKFVTGILVHIAGVAVVIGLIVLVAGLVLPNRRV